MLKFSYGWIDKWHKAKRAVVSSGMQLSTIMGHKFHSLRLLELFSCAFITNSHEWRLYRRIMPLTILRKISFEGEKIFEYIFRKRYGCLSRIFACLTHFCQGGFCDRSHIQHYTSAYEKMKCRYENETVSLSLVAIKFPFGLQNYWKKKFLIPLIALNWSVCFNNFFCWVTREVLFQQSGKHQYQLSSK